MKILARHTDWVSNAKITESYDEHYQGQYSYIRYTATICGFRNWKLFEGDLKNFSVDLLISKVKKIKELIEEDNFDEAEKYNNYKLNN